jgi:hypothetical protein
MEIQLDKETESEDPLKDVFERMQPRAAALVKDDQLEQFKSKLEQLYKNIGNADLYLLNDLLDDWICLTTQEDGSLAAVIAVRFARLR